MVTLLQFDNVQPLKRPLLDSDMVVGCSNGGAGLQNKCAHLTPWHTLVASLWAALTCGFLYTFSTFSSALKEKFDLSEGELNTIGMGQASVGLLTFLCGLLVDSAGVGFSLIFGALLNSTAWVVFGSVCIAYAPSPDAAGAASASGRSVFVTVLAASAGAATGAGAIVTAAVFAVITKNFGEKRAAAIGIAKAWVGVAAGVATTVFIGLFPSSDNSPERLNYVWFLAVCCGLCPLLQAPCIRILDSSTSVSSDHLCIPPRYRFGYLTASTLVLVAVTATAALLHKVATASQNALLSLMLLVILASPAALLFPKPRYSGKKSGNAPDDMSPIVDSRDDGALDASERSHNVQELPVKAASPWACGPLEMISRSDAWLLWIVIFALQSGGILLTTNLGSITESRSGPKASSATAVAIFSCSQSMGRLFGGMLSDMVVSYRVTRPAFLVLLCFCMGLAHSTICISGPSALYGGVALAGISFGCMYPVMIIIIAELFGTARIASNYMVYDGSPSASAAILIGKYLAQYVYEVHANGSSTCYGDECFRLTHIVVANTQVIAALAATTLAFRALPVYQVAVWPKLHIEVEDVIPVRSDSNLGLDVRRKGVQADSKIAGAAPRVMGLPVS